MSTTIQAATGRPVTITIAGAEIGAVLTVPADARGLVLLAHGSGASRHDARNQQLARILNDASLATLLCDLLTDEEEVLNEITGEFREDAALLSYRLIGVVDWCAAQSELRHMPLGLFGADVGGAAAVIAATARPDVVRALVLRSARLDLAWTSLPSVRVPALLVAGELDAATRASYDVALASFRDCEREVLVIPRAGHLFLEGTTRQQLGEHAARWFTEHLNLWMAPSADFTSEVC